MSVVSVFSSRIAQPDDSFHHLSLELDLTAKHKFRKDIAVAAVVKRFLFGPAGDRLLCRCYLLMKNDPWVYLNIDWAGKYEHMRRLFREYGDIINADYGVPVGPRHKENNLWKRKYSKGLVVVNPIKHTLDFIPETQY